MVGRFGEQLTGWLVDIAARTFEGEFGPRSTGGTIEGSRERFVESVRGLAEPGRLAELFARYPVLARLLGETARLAVEAQVELMARFATDRGAIVTNLLGGVDPGPVVAVEARRGDPHRGGRSVSVIVFGDGRRVVYRPRDVRSHMRFAELVGWLNDVAPGIGLRTADVLAGDGYGWLEFVGGGAPMTTDEAPRFYRRLGALLALLHVVRAVDMHHENVVADGDQPVLVDVETLFHPELPAPHSAADPAGRALAASVYRTGLLPQFVAGMDISGVWSGPRQTEPADHVAALLSGFRCGYNAIAHHRAEFATLVERQADLEVRVLVRSTRHYARLVAETNRPDLLRDLRDRERVLGAALGGGRLARYEMASMRAGDVPLFVGRPDSLDIRTSDGQWLSGMVLRTGLSGALDTVSAMSEVDRRDQEWVISATMASRRPAGHDDGPAMPGPVPGAVADPQRLLAAACAVADQVVSRSMVDRDRVNWLGLELVDERQWLVLPMGAGLANGYLGVALFLAQLAELSGVARYEQMARRAIAGLPRLFERLAAQPAMVAAIGCGGLHGFGGIAYGLARLATLLGDDEVRELAGAAVGFAAAAAEPSSPGWATGTAGCLAAMTAVHAELGLPEAARLAVACAGHLVTTVDSEAPLPAGFADGAAGVAWALTRSAARLPDGAEPRHTDAASTAAARAAAAAQLVVMTETAETTRMAAAACGAEGTQSTAGTWSAEAAVVTHASEGMRVTTAVDSGHTGSGWCAGIAGLALAGTVSGGVSGGGASGPRFDGPMDHRQSGVVGGTSRPWERGVLPRELTERPVLRDLSLCHGELGIAEVLAAVPGGEPARRRHAGLVLDAIDRYGPCCGTPDGVPTPGLLTGLAGIGYGLLRLGFPNRVPSALLLEPVGGDREK